MKSHIRIKEITFFAGKTINDTELKVKPSSVTVVVGPNNSGKSLALKELEDWCYGDDSGRKIIKEINLAYPKGSKTIDSIYNFFKTNPPPNQPIPADHAYIVHRSFKQGQSVRNLIVNINQIKQAVNTPDLNLLRQQLFSLFTVRLDGKTRFVLTDDKQSSDLQRAPENHLVALFQDDSSRKKLRKRIFESIGSYFVIDPTGLTTFRIRLSTTNPKDKSLEQSLEKKTRDFHAKATHIKEFSDGVQAYVGLLSAIYSLPDTIILIDEPEAFLHPPLARRLGRYLVEVAAERKASLVVSTHSADFLMGCLESTSSSTVVRLTYEKKKATARTLSREDLDVLTKDPLLRSTGIYKGLFHNGVVVTESDVDRAFYDEIHRRVFKNKSDESNLLFLNAWEKATVYRIVKPLRKIGIPATAVVDLDFLKDNDTLWDALLEACQIPSSEWDRLKGKRDILKALFAAMSTPPGGKHPIKFGGISSLAPIDQTVAKALLKELAEYGLFMVPVGELEAWLPTLNIKDHGPKWLTKIFRKIGTSESDANYLKPANNDVWLFVKEISKWIENPSKKGVA